MENLEFVKTIAPYIVAIVAIGGTFVTSALAQRNWQKQFLAQQAVLLFNKRIELASEVPSKLFEIWRYYVESLSKARLAETLLILKTEGRDVSDEAINNLSKDQVEATKAFQIGINEYLEMCFSIKAFFDEEILNESSVCLSLINQLYISQQKGAAEFRSKLKQCVLPDMPFEESLDTMSITINDHLLSASKDINPRMGNLASMMVDYAKTSGKK